MNTTPLYKLMRAIMFWSVFFFQFESSFGLKNNALKKRSVFGVRISIVHAYHTDDDTERTKTVTPTTQ